MGVTKNQHNIFNTNTRAHGLLWLWKECVLSSRLRITGNPAQATNIEIIEVISTVSRSYSNWGPPFHLTPSKLPLKYRHVTSNYLKVVWNQSQAGYGIAAVFCAKRRLQVWRMRCVQKELGGLVTRLVACNKSSTDTRPVKREGINDVFIALCHGQRKTRDSRVKNIRPKRRSRRDTTTEYDDVQRVDVVGGCAWKYMGKILVVCTTQCKYKLL